MHARATNNYADHTSLPVGKKGELIASVATAHLHPDYTEGAFPTMGGYGGGLKHRTVNFIYDAKGNRGDLPSITGIGASKARFSPVWQLGELPRV